MANTMMQCVSLRVLDIGASTRTEASFECGDCVLDAIFQSYYDVPFKIGMCYEANAILAAVSGSSEKP